MNQIFEEVLIEDPTENQHGFIFFSQDENFTDDNIYEMDLDMSANSIIDNQFSLLNYSNMCKLGIKPSNNFSPSQISIGEIQTQSQIKEDNNGNQLKNFTSAFRYPTIFSSSAKMFQIENVVATADFKCQLRLEELFLKIRNTEYNPNLFKALIIKIAKPFSNVLLFPSGKVICVGAKSEENAKKAIKIVAKIMIKQGYAIKLTRMKIQNLICGINIQQPIDLKDFAQKNDQFCSYNPELFSGLIFKMTHFGIKIIIFSSGEMLFTGTNDRSIINKAFNSIYSILQQYKKRKQT